MQWFDSTGIFGYACSKDTQVSITNARYKLLLEDLYKHTPTDHPDYENLEKSIKVISEVANYVNETIRDHEMMVNMLNIQKSFIGLKQVSSNNKNILIPGRKFLKRGRVQKICRRNHQPRELFLFSDMLIYASPSIIEEHYHFHRIIPFEYCRVQDFGQIRGKHVFQIFSREKSFEIYTDSAEETKSWVNALTNALNEYQIANQSLQRDVLPNASPMERFDAPVWMPDEYAKACLVCFKEFSMFLRKHHCRSCGIVVCHFCSRNSFCITYKDGERLARVCDTCLPSMIQERKFRIVTPSASDFRESSESRRDSIDSRRTSMSTTGSRTSYDVSSLFRSRRNRSNRGFDVLSICSTLAGVSITN